MRYIELYFDPSTRLTYARKLDCDICKEDIFDRALIFCKWSDRKNIPSAILISCTGCMEKAISDRKLFNAMESRVVILGLVPSKSYRIYLTPPNFKHTKHSLSVYDIADQQYDGETIIDYTVHSKEQAPALPFEDKKKIGDKNNG